VVTQDRQARRLSVVDFPSPVQPLTRLRIGKSFNARVPAQRRDLAAQLRDRTRSMVDRREEPLGGLDELDRREEPLDRRVELADDDAEVRRLRAALGAHPCASCPDREDHARWGERFVKLERETETIRRRIESRTNTIARQFDRVYEVLTELNYLSGDSVTEAGSALARIYSELDLVAAECLRQSVWDGLEAPALAAVLSALAYESRTPDLERPRVPGGAVTRVLGEMTRIWARLDALEREHRLSFLREPDVGFAAAAYRWAGGATLEEVLDETDLAPGDFVRWVKQLLDLTEQVADAAGDSPLRRTAREVTRSMRRGVVTYSSDIAS
jgi:ATP-dependent RNA helicase HelY